MSEPRALRKFRKVLIANRGEIACRVIRACRELGIATVAVYSEADREAVHVRMADEAVLLGPPPARDSYLAVDRLLRAITDTRADAVHPGYGFLSENAGFAEAVGATGAVFIGPPVAAIRAMGGKTSARALMEKAGVPVVPGDNGPGGQGFASPDEARAAAARIGYPVLLKAAAGGGGRGMRLVAAEGQLEAALASARREAKAAFADDAVYLEKAIVRPRHIEIQVFGDVHGNVVHLGERDCSIQRRNQKVIEESPSPGLDPDPDADVGTRPRPGSGPGDGVRARMGAVAVRAARSVGYVGAGTIEMLFDGASRSFYFLEMNTRLQVEHPVTELVTGVDLVRWQIDVAQGGRLPEAVVAAGEVPRRGAAIECRIYAEDPVKFLPSPGRITSLQVPAGPGIRDDSGVQVGSVISTHYDPMISKLCAFADTRAAALERMRRALAEYHVGGIRTNLAFHRRMVRHPRFLAGDYDTGFIERHAAELAPPPADDESRELAMIAAALTARAEGLGREWPLDEAAVQPSAWRRP
jgi:acetyl-CoA carboxylase, biotin carboxylase subunit